MSRFLVLFAREPALQAREKGLASAAAELFREFAAGWLEAARQTRARLVVAAPPEDLAAWRRVFRGAPGPHVWIGQRGGVFGVRLEDAARRAAALGGHAVLVGGDVPPSASALSEAFAAIEGGADAAVSPAPDGGVSLLALSHADLDLLRQMRERRRTVLADLLRRLEERGRQVWIAHPMADVDGRAALRALLRERMIPLSLVVAARRALTRPVFLPARALSRPLAGALHGPPILRGPPLPA